VKSTRERCAFHAMYDPVTWEPTGPKCGRVATHAIWWRDGRRSPACPKHGLKALDPDAREMVVAFENLKIKTRRQP
jgi:hypothetical protein